MPHAMCTGSAGTKRQHCPSSRAAGSTVTWRFSVCGASSATRRRRHVSARGQSFWKQMAQSWGASVKVSCFIGYTVICFNAAKIQHFFIISKFFCLFLQKIPHFFALFSLNSPQPYFLIINHLHSLCGEFRHFFQKSHPCARMNANLGCLKRANLVLY